MRWRAGSHQRTVFVFRICTKLCLRRRETLTRRFALPPLPSEIGWFHPARRREAGLSVGSGLPPKNRRFYRVQDSGHVRKRALIGF
jgi:hypothetical protein